jgi:hypothetical protein
MKFARPREFARFGLDIFQPVHSTCLRRPGRNSRIIGREAAPTLTINAPSQATKLTRFSVATTSYELRQVKASGTYVVKRPERLAADETTRSALLRLALDCRGHDRPL